jgi:hypothetical protein
MSDLTEDDEFNLLLDDEWDVDPPDEENDDPEAVLTRLRASLLAVVPRVDIELANARAPLGGPGRVACVCRVAARAGVAL